MCLHGANPGLVGLLTIEEGSPNACARSSMPFSVAGYDNSCEWPVSKQWIQMLVKSSLFSLLRLVVGSDLTLPALLI